MNLIVCVDKKDGMTFGGRRQSMDRVLREDLIKTAAGKTLWMDTYSAGQFEDVKQIIRTDDDYRNKVKAGECCFSEKGDLLFFAGKLQSVTVYRWDRVYPADKYFDRSLLDGLKLISTTEFAGYSHERIIKEVYSK